MNRLTIRMRITGGSLLIAVLISVVVGVLIYSQVERIVIDGQVTVLTNVEAPYLTALTTEVTEEVDAPGPTQLVAVVDPAGARKVDTLPASLSAGLDDVAGRAGTTSTLYSGGQSYLVRVTTVDTRTGSWLVVSAVDDDAQVSVLNQVAALLIASMAGINLAFGAASWLIGSAALSPVTRLRRSAANLMQGPSAELLPVGPVRDEIAALARTLNELIAALRLSAERERQIVSDASHELRTPLAIISAQLELAQAEASSLEQMRGDVSAAQHTLARLTTLATSLLELSRIDGQSVPGHSTVADLATELGDAADRGRTRVGGRDIRIDYLAATRLTDSRQVDIATDDFGRVCDNLVNNSLAAMGGHGSIELALSIEDRILVLRVTDDAGGMSAEFAPHAFERFSQGDAARTGIGAGLGLSIVAGIVAVAGGTIEIANSPGVGVAVAAHLPFSISR